MMKNWDDVRDKGNHIEPIKLTPKEFHLFDGVEGNILKMFVKRYKLDVTLVAPHDMVKANVAIANHM